MRAAARVCRAERRWSSSDTEVTVRFTGALRGMSRRALRLGKKQGPPAVRKGRHENGPKQVSTAGTGFAPLDAGKRWWWLSTLDVEVTLATA